MEKIKGYADKIDGHEVLAYLRDEFKESFPEAPENSQFDRRNMRPMGSFCKNDYESQSDDDDPSPDKPKKKKKKNKSREGRAAKKDEADKGGMFKGMKGFFGISKKEQ
jgi:hypothetical protein|tara:strand:- start:86 stop:409 length:324 start_codon:yes stop_codon:yes gene_type:complete